MAETSKSLDCGAISIKWNDKLPDADSLRAVTFRQTSRKRYTEGLSSDEKDAIERIVHTKGMNLSLLNEESARQTVWLNQRAVFDDMFNEPVRNELRQWMRTSHTEKITKRDGLSYDCMEMSGAALRFFLNHYRVLRWPILSGILEKYYLRTMKDSSSVAYMAAPINTESDAYDAGQIIMKIWIELSKAGAYLHPFGTIVSNDQAHADFLKLIGKTETDESRVVFIFRAGRSPVPVRSERLELKELIRGSDA